MLPAPRSALRLIAFLAFAASPAVFAQGSLTPLGAPAPTMKSLSELDTSLTALAAKTDARIAIDTLPGDATALRIISAPGSYYLRGNLSTASDTVSAIRVTTNGVVIDLNGFALTGSGATSTASGIDLGGGALKRIVVRNGTLTGWFIGVETAEGILVSDLVMESCVRSGAELGLDSIARHVLVRNVGSIGIQAGTVEDCRVKTASGAGGSAFGIVGNIVRDCEVSGITSTSPGFSYGIQGSLVTNSRITDVTSAKEAAGIYLYGSTFTTATGCTVNNVSATASDGVAYGIYATNVSNCGITNITGAGLNTYGINASSVSASNVSVVTASLGNAYGVQAFNVSDTNVSSVTANVSLYLSYGINAALVRGCRVILIGGSPSAAAGITGYEIFDNYVASVNPSSGTGTGINCQPGAVVRGNTVTLCRNSGIACGGTDVFVTNNIVRSINSDVAVTTGAGILVNGTSCRVENNVVVGGMGSDYGIRVTSTLCFLAGNRCSGTFSGAATGATGVDTSEYNIVTGNRFGPIVGTFAATGEITATNPYANFSD